MNVNFTDIIAASERLPVYLIRGVDPQHGPCWYYLEVDSAKHDKFRKEYSTSNCINIKHFGRVISSGWGDYPPISTTKLLSTEGMID